MTTLDILRDELRELDAEKLGAWHLRGVMGLAPAPDPTYCVGAGPTRNAVMESV